MKKLILLAALAVTAGFTACNKENESVSPSGKNSTLMISLPGNAVGRSVQDAVVTGTTTALTNVTVFLLNNDAVVGDPVEFVSADITAKFKLIENVSSTVNKVLVLANTPASEATAVKQLKFASQIKAYGFSIAEQNTGNGIAAKTHIGEAACVLDTPGSNDTPDLKKADVTLNALTARFEVGDVKKGEGVKSVELVGVWINGYYEDGSKESVKTNGSDSPFWNLNASTGVATTAFDNVQPSTPYVPAAYYDAYSSDVKVEASSKVYAYHVFAGSNIPHVILLVQGEYETEQTEGAGDKYFLGFVTFSKFIYQGSPIASITANDIYKIGVGATGITIDAKHITPKPELENFDLQVNVTITPWTEKNVTPGV